MPTLTIYNCHKFELGNYIFTKTATLTQFLNITVEINSSQLFTQDSLQRCIQLPPTSNVVKRAVLTQSLFTTATSCSPINTVILTVLGLIALALVVTNSLTILVILCDAKLRNGQGVFRANLAFLDFSIGAFLIPVAIYFNYTLVWQPQFYPAIPAGHMAYMSKLFSAGKVDYSKVNYKVLKATVLHYNKWTVSHGLQSLHGFAFAFLVYSRIYILSVMAIDRLIAVYMPFRYTQAVSKKFSYIACVLVWIPIAACASFPVFHYQNMSFITTLQMFVVSTGNKAVEFFLFFLPIGLMWSMSILLYVKIKMHNSALEHKTEQQEAMLKNTENRVMKTLMIMVFVFTTATMPLLVLSTYLGIAPVNFKQQTFPVGKIIWVKDFMMAAFIILFANGIFNFFIYQSRDKKFMATLRKLLGLKVEEFDRGSMQSTRTTTTSRSIKD